jgi:hypothetical protein
MIISNISIGLSKQGSDRSRPEKYKDGDRFADLDQLSCHHDFGLKMHRLFAPSSWNFRSNGDLRPISQYGEMIKYSSYRSSQTECSSTASKSTLSRVNAEELRLSEIRLPISPCGFLTPVRYRGGCFDINPTILGTTETN